MFSKGCAISGDSEMLGSVCFLMGFNDVIEFWGPAAILRRFRPRIDLEKFNGFIVFQIKIFISQIPEPCRLLPTPPERRRRAAEWCAIAAPCAARNTASWRGLHPSAVLHLLWRTQWIMCGQDCVHGDGLRCSQEVGRGGVGPPRRSRRRNSRGSPA